MRDDDPIRVDYEGILHGRIRAEKQPVAETPKEDPDVVELGKCVQVYTKGAKAVTIEVPGKLPESFQYAHITHHSGWGEHKEGPYKGELYFWFVFGTTEKHKIIITGRRCRDVWNRIDDHCVRIIHAQARKFDPGDDKPYVFHVEVIALPKEWEGD